MWLQTCGQTDAQESLPAQAEGSVLAVGYCQDTSMSGTAHTACFYKEVLLECLRLDGSRGTCKIRVKFTGQLSKKDETLAAPSCRLVWLSARTGLSNAMLPMSLAALGGLLAARPFSSLRLILARLHASPASRLNEGEVQIISMHFCLLAC